MIGLAAKVSFFLPSLPSQWRDDRIFWMVLERPMRALNIHGLPMQVYQLRFVRTYFHGIIVPAACSLPKSDLAWPSHRDELAPNRKSACQFHTFAGRGHLTLAGLHHCAREFHLVHILTLLLAAPTPGKRTTRYIFLLARLPALEIS